MKSEVGLSFAIHGVTPADIRKNKIEILLNGGLNRVRMGVQSGSDKILKFYKRPNRAESSSRRSTRWASSPTA